MARSGMASLITRLRGLCDAGTADYTVGATTYWTDDQLQDTLDANRMDVRRLPLMVSPEQVSSESQYYDYYFPAGDVEEAASGSAVWAVEDSTGADVGTANYSVNYRAGHIRFTSDTDGTAYYLNYREYDINRAAADVWEAKAASVADRFDVRIDNHQLTRSQLYTHYMQQARAYRSRGRVRTVLAHRGDVNV